MNKRPWVELGLEEPKFQKVLDEFLMSEVEKMVDGEIQLLIMSLRRQDSKYPNLTNFFL